MLNRMNGVSTASPRDSKGLCLLSMDGGGVRGLSSLFMLRDIMNQLSSERHHSDRLKPCDIFDLIGGTSTGGLIAIMLGRLEMNVDECIMAYTQLMKSVFSEKLSNLPVDLSGDIKAQYDIRRLKSAVEDVVCRAGASADDLMDDGVPRRCRVFVCTTAKESLQITRLRSYAVSNVESSEAGIPATICDAALATAAATGFFEPVTIGNRQFVDGAFGANNPIEEVEGEATDIWCPTTRDLKPLVKCIVSLGTGNPGQKALDDKIFQFLTKSLVRMATKPEGIERRFVARWNKEYKEKRYFRFNVEKGLNDVQMTDYLKKSVIESMTIDYLQQASQKSRIRDCILNLVGKEEKSDVNLEEIVQEHSARALRHEFLRTSQSNNSFMPRNQPEWIVPFERNPDFVDREMLRQLKQRLFSTGSPRRLAIYGLGGVGKTQIVIELAHQAREKWEEFSVLWIPAVDKQSILQSSQEIAAKLGLHLQETEKEDPRDLLRKYLERSDSGPWLIIYDNADDFDIWKSSAETEESGMESFLPHSDRVSILFTTRSRRVAQRLASREIIEIPEMDEHRAATLLQNSLIQKSLTDDKDKTRLLLERLTFLPLAIVQAASFMNENEADIPGYMKLLDGEEQSAIELLSEEFEDEGRYKSSRNPIADTWLTSFKQIASQSELSADCLSFMACINTREIPINLLPGSSALERRKAIGILSSYSFIKIRPGDELVDMHRLVQLAMRNRLRHQNKLRTWQCKVADALKAQSYFDSKMPTIMLSRDVWYPNCPHAIHLVESFPENQMDWKWCELLNTVSYCLQLDGRPKEAEKYCLKMLPIVDRIGGNLQVKMRNNCLLRGIYEVLGRYDEAESMAKEALKICQEIPHVGPDDDEILTINSDLSSICLRTGRYEESEKLCRHVLEVFLRRYGPLHEMSLRNIVILSHIYVSTGRLYNAERLNKQQISILKELHGMDHPITLLALAGLGQVYHEQWKLEKAEDVRREVLERSRRLYGPDSPQTMTAMAYLALVLNCQCHYDEALSLMAECAELRERVLGSSHPDTQFANRWINYWSQLRLFGSVWYRYNAGFLEKGRLRISRMQYYSKFKKLGGHYYSVSRQPKDDRLLDQITEAVRTASLTRNVSSYQGAHSKTQADEPPSQYEEHHGLGKVEGKRPLNSIE